MYIIYTLYLYKFMANVLCHASLVAVACQPLIFEAMWCLHSPNPFTPFTNEDPVRYHKYPNKKKKRKRKPSPPTFLQLSQLSPSDGQKKVGLILRSLFAGAEFRNRSPDLQSRQVSPTLMPCPRTVSPGTGKHRKTPALLGPKKKLLPFSALGISIGIWQMTFETAKWIRDET